MTSCDDAEDDNRPNTPAEEDCCGNACNPCVFDVHKKLLEAWEKKKLNERKIPPDKNYLSLTRYNKFIIKDIRKACEECIFIQLECGSGMIIVPRSFWQKVFVSYINFYKYNNDKLLFRKSR